MNGLALVAGYFHRSDRVTVCRVKDRFNEPSGAGWTDMVCKPSRRCLFDVAGPTNNTTTPAHLADAQFLLQRRSEQARVRGAAHPLQDAVPAHSSRRYLIFVPSLNAGPHRLLKYYCVLLPCRTQGLQHLSGNGFFLQLQTRVPGCLCTHILTCDLPVGCIRAS